MARGSLRHLVTLALAALSAVTTLHCAEGEEFDPASARAGGAGKGGSNAGSGGSLAAGGASGTTTTGGESGSNGSPMDASASGGQGGGGQGGGLGSGGGPVESGAAGSGMTDVMVYDVAPCPTCALTVQYSLQKTNDPTNEIGFNLHITNTGKNSVPANQISLRYWYTINGEAAQESAIDHSKPSGASFQFVKVMPARAGADYYAEMKFTAAGDLAVGQVAELHIRFHKQGYNGNYDQKDDYSYGAGHTAFGDWPKITAYIGGDMTPVWGTEP